LLAAWVTHGGEESRRHLVPHEPLAILRVRRRVEGGLQHVHIEKPHRNNKLYWSCSHSWRSLRIE
jgi:hypothetical protein